RLRDARRASRGVEAAAAERLALFSAAERRSARAGALARRRRHSSTATRSRRRAATLASLSDPGLSQDLVRAARRLAGRAVPALVATRVDQRLHGRRVRRARSLGR